MKSKFHEIAEALQERIDSGYYTDRLPSEQELAQQFNTALATIRKSLDILLARGIIRKVPYVGTFLQREARKTVRIAWRPLNFCQEGDREIREAVTKHFRDFSVEFVSDFKTIDIRDCDLIRSVATASLSFSESVLPLPLDVIEKYRHIEELPEDTEIPEKRYIWLLWWQGEETAPPLVRSCISSTRENANGAEVVIITKDNCSSYIDIPSYILEKKEKGYISFAQLSDIIRYMLLSRYGGLWLDATVYTAAPVPSEYFAYNFFSQHTKPAKHTCWVQNNAYHGFIVASRKGAKLASFMNEVFLEYWKRHDTLVDYLMIDYMITLAMHYK